MIGIIRITAVLVSICQNTNDEQTTLPFMFKLSVLTINNARLNEVSFYGTIEFVGFYLQISKKNNSHSLLLHIVTLTQRCLDRVMSTKQTNT